MSLVSHYLSFKRSGNLKFHNSIIKYVHYIFLRIKYGVGINDYFVNELFKSGKQQSRFWNTSHKYIHSWKNVTRSFAPDKSNIWLFFHYLDYLIAKIYCPGVDAMDYFRYEWFRLVPSARKGFITEGYLPKMVKMLNGGSETNEIKDLFKNKAKFNRFFSEFISRKWFVNLEVDENEFVIRTLDIKNIICKPIDEGGGKGIFTRTVNSIDDARKLYNELKAHPFIIEEIIQQHDVLAKICPSSVNTIRVFSVNTTGIAKVVSACLRIGNGTSHTDNYSSGGLVTEIDIDNGIVVSRAVNQYGLSTYIHPYTKMPIIGTIIPNWDKILQTVISAHEKVPELGYIGWDVVVCSDNTITFIEGNTTSGVELQQHAPLIGKMKIYKPYIDKSKYGRKK